ncbi:MAG: hypothetical protein ACD_19C00176G0027 [uncultured bacterium]|nr:MAG: hypothetical protein ACD_19C00176G0027 [uncultured bacterium]
MKHQKTIFVLFSLETVGKDYNPHQNGFFNGFVRSDLANMI